VPRVGSGGRAACGCHGLGFGSCGCAQRLAEFHVPAHVAWGIGVGDVAGNDALALGTQHQGLALEIEPVRHLV
jgi:hypothetical protein